MMSVARHGGSQTRRTSILRVIGALLPLLLGFYLVVLAVKAVASIPRRTWQLARATAHASVTALAGAFTEAFRGKSGVLIAWALNFVLVAPLLAPVESMRTARLLVAAALLGLLATALEKVLAVAVARVGAGLFPHFTKMAAATFVALTAAETALGLTNGLTPVPVLLVILLAVSTVRETALYIYAEMRSVSFGTLARVAATAWVAFVIAQQHAKLGLGAAYTVALISIITIVYLFSDRPVPQQRYVGAY